ncbi:hypothetical protein ACFY93_32950, partial [Streptomyces sp. NPDC008313]
TPQVIPSTGGHSHAEPGGQRPRCRTAKKITGGAVDRLRSVRKQVVTSIKALQNRGVDVATPVTVTDALLDERHPARSSPTTWHLPLSRQAGSLGGGVINIRYAVVLTAVKFPCDFPTSIKPSHSADWIVNRDAAMLWAAKTVKAEKPYVAWRKSEYAGLFENSAEVLDKVQERADRGYALPPAEQSRWFHREQAKACSLLKGATS